MNGIHDMGGMHGFGRVEVEPDEPVFHERWEGRVFGIVVSRPDLNIDAVRHALERLDPVTYLADGYYGRWLAGLVSTLRESGVLVAGEIEARMHTAAEGPAVSPPGTRAPAPTGPRAGSTREGVAPATGYAREVADPPAFRNGQRVRTRNHQPAGHTRLPGYARLRRGVVVRVHPAMVFPDDHAHGRGENPQYVYTVRFEGRELWGADAEPRALVHLDLFESYLEPA